MTTLLQISERVSVKESEKWSLFNDKNSVTYFFDSLCSRLSRGIGLSNIKLEATVSLHNAQHC